MYTVDWLLDKQYADNYFNFDFFPQCDSFNKVNQKVILLQAKIPQ